MKISINNYHHDYHYDVYTDLLSPLILSFIVEEVINMSRKLLLSNPQEEIRCWVK